MTEPSKVLHIRNVGPEVTEHDLLQLAQAFGVPQKVVMLRAKNQVCLIRSFLEKMVAEITSLKILL
jgi:polypyrimidine tract-binding protein 2